MDPHVSHCPFACAHAASRHLHASARAAVSAIITHASLMQGNAVAHQKHLTRYQSHSCSTVECMQLPMATAQHITGSAMCACSHVLTRSPEPGLCTTMACLLQARGQQALQGARAQQVCTDRMPGICLGPCNACSFELGLPIVRNGDSLAVHTAAVSSASNCVSGLHGRTAAGRQ